jgi:hypothetical protein
MDYFSQSPIHVVHFRNCACSRRTKPSRPTKSNNPFIKKLPNWVFFQLHCSWGYCSCRSTIFKWSFYFQSIFAGKSSVLLTNNERFLLSYHLYGSNFSKECSFLLKETWIIIWYFQIFGWHRHLFGWNFSVSSLIWIKTCALAKCYLKEQPAIHSGGIFSLDCQIS